MMFPEESLYGWGVYEIRMPRAVHDIYSDKWKNIFKTPCSGKRKAGSHPWRLFNTSRIFIDDFPWGQTLLLTLLSALVLASISVINSALPRNQDEQLSKPVDIIISVLEEEDRRNISPTNPIKEKQLPTTDYDHVEQEVVAKPVAEEPQQIIMTELKDTDRVSQRTGSKVVNNFVSRKNNKPAIHSVHAGRLRRKYESSVSNLEKSRTPQQMPSTAPFAFNRLAETAEVALPNTDQANHRPALKGNGSRLPRQAAPLSTDQLISFQPQERKENPILKPQTQARSFSTRPPQRHSGSQGTVRGTKFATPQQQIPVLDATLPKRRLSDERYVFAEKARHQSQTEQNTNQKFSLQPRKQQESLLPISPAMTKSVSKDFRPPQKSSTSLARAPDFSAEVLPDEIDPSHLISLTEFKVCTDPEEEFRLKTQLAIRLDGPSWFKAGRVLFFCKYPESGYTMQVAVYNPQRRIFKDRCEVLQLAVKVIRDIVK
jgi:hypothetical protein